ncbi:MAG: hypothetical protein ACKO0U_08455 [Gammaproteobacteria bacterium]
MNQPPSPTPPPVDDETDELPGSAPQELGPAGRNLAMILWPSFLAAGVATMFVFAWVDPLALEACAVPTPLLGGRLAGYGLGFFFFWGITASASAITLYLSCTLGQRPGESK